MAKLRDYVKRTALYRSSFFLRYMKETVALHLRRRSFAEYGEDLIVERLLGKPVEFFIDIGANDGFHSSNTFYFALRGARGVCFEPIPELYASLRSLHLLNYKVKCLRCGLSDENKNASMISLEGLSYIPETQDLGHKLLHQAEHSLAPKVLEIPLLRFQDAISGLDVPGIIDLLTVDVEGHELKVLRSIPFERYRFRIIIIETHQLGDDGQYLWKHRDYEAIVGLLGNRGYRPAQTTAANTIFIGESVLPLPLETKLVLARASL